MKKIKILNLFAGIGGNRELWDSDLYDVTSVEFDPNIAAIYKKRFPNDDVLVLDAYDYILDHYLDYDFIWASPVCTSHSRVRFPLVGHNRKAVLPDFRLYSLITFLSKHCKSKFVVENVIPYYDPLISPTVKIDRHYYWSNFDINPISFQKDKRICNIKLSDFSHIDFSCYPGRSDTLIRNMVNPVIGLHILNSAFDSVPYSYEPDNLFSVCGLQ